MARLERPTSPGTWGALTTHTVVKAPQVCSVAKRGTFIATDCGERGRSPVSVARNLWNAGPGRPHAQPRSASPERAWHWARPGARAAGVRPVSAGVVGARPTTAGPRIAPREAAPRRAAPWRRAAPGRVAPGRAKPHGHGAALRATCGAAPRDAAPGRVALCR